MSTVDSVSQLLQRAQAHIQQAQFSLAQASLEQIKTSSNKDELQKLYLLAVVQRMQQQHENALSTLEQLLNIAPEHARAYQEQGYNYLALNQKARAAAAFYRATQANPALLSAWKMLLPIYQEQQQAQAIKLSQTQIEQLSAMPPLLLSATDLMHEGDLLTADKLCRQFLQSNKHDIQALLLLAEIALRLKAISEAEFILETCVELAPQNADALYALYKTYSKLGKFQDALKSAEKLLQQASDNVFYMAAKATALVGVGELQDGIALYNEIINKGNEEANIYLLLGHAYKTSGQFDSAVSAYQACYRLQANLGDAYWSLANTKTYRFAQDEIDAMLTLIDDDGSSITDKIHFAFALGKAFEDRKDYQSSFTFYARGNQLHKQQSQYDKDKHHAFIQLQIQSYTKDFIAPLLDKGCMDQAPIFIVGMPRAGSTLIEQILSSHSQVDGTMELHEILGLAARLSKQVKQPYPSILGQIPSDYLRQFGEQFIQNTQVYRHGAAFFIDKMPNNFMHIGLIKLILPNAKIIDARRDINACCFSGFKQLFGEGQEFSYSLTDIVHYYKDYLALMAHWDQLFPDQILRVQHEELVNNTEHEIRRILDYCQLPFEASCLSFYENKRAVKTPSAEQVRQPIFKSGLEQWKHYEPYLQEMLDAIESHT